MEFNIEDLLNDLRADICRVYDKNIPADKQPKQTIDILTVTQLHFITLYIGTRM
jgi:hypothetical protein